MNNSMHNDANMPSERPSVAFRHAFLPLCVLLFAASVAHGEPTQQDVLHSINDSIGDSIDMTKLLGAAGLVASVAMLISLLNYRHKQRATPKVVNHSGKLLKEITRRVNLKAIEVKQLRMLADSQHVSSPLVLLLCPSLLEKAVKQNGERVDRRIVLGMLKRVGTGQRGT
jgi:hypothetical protein